MTVNGCGAGADSFPACGRGRETAERLGPHLFQFLSGWVCEHEDGGGLLSCPKWEEDPAHENIFVRSRPISSLPMSKITGVSLQIPGQREVLKEEEMNEVIFKVSASISKGFKHR